MASIFTKRLTKELKDLNTNPPEGVVVEEADNLKSWKIKLIGAAGTIYEGEEFKLEFRFTPQYPLEAPDVVFVRPFVPVHPHIYSNGHICLNILYKDWSPVQTVAHVCLSIISMISSCTKKELPPDNDLYIKSASASPKKTAWAFQ
ncbi:ubiquitin-conjugating enzyme/RWD-like protein [Mucor lusitanicus]|uniref:Ubiquitin-conjugating enzyme/RWD-like protein n=1 Tax=Mucor circinelloides f. lusitanicus TaxID=29924 RepID=A0A8H4EY94_MUCCL|nr:ubiquitin-conjugating enzyme/RWD-like protein [Mucor lusitanicus]